MGDRRGGSGDHGFLVCTHAPKFPQRTALGPIYNPKPENLKARPYGMYLGPFGGVEFPPNFLYIPSGPLFLRSPILWQSIKGSL